MVHVGLLLLIHLPSNASCPNVFRFDYSAGVQRGILAVSRSYKLRRKLDRLIAVPVHGSLLTRLKSAVKGQSFDPSLIAKVGGSLYIYCPSRWVMYVYVRMMCVLAGRPNSWGGGRMVAGIRGLR